MLVYTLPSEYKSAIFYVSRGWFGILGLLFCQTYGVNLVLINQ